MARWTEMRDAALAKSGRKVLTVHYEDLREDYEGVCKQILDYIGLKDVVPPPPHSQRMKTQYTDTFMDSYKKFLGI